LAFGDDRGSRRWLRGVIAGDGRAAEPVDTTSGGAGGNPDLFSGVAGPGVFGGLSGACVWAFAELAKSFSSSVFGFSLNRGLSGSFFNTCVNFHVSHPVAPRRAPLPEILLLLFDFLR